MSHCHITWQDFRDLFLEEYVAHRSASYTIAVSSTFNVAEKLMNPDKLSRISATWLSRFKVVARNRQKLSATIHKYMQHLKTALMQACDQGYLQSVPKFPKEIRGSNKGKRCMKGRPLTESEFTRMLAAVSETLPQHQHRQSELMAAEESLRYLLTGLWLSGLRLSEALSLTWDQWSDGIRIEIDQDGDVFLLINGDDQKNGKAQLYPVVDDFAEFLFQASPEARQGFVFNPFRVRGSISRRVDTVSNWIVAIGKQSRVQVDTRRSRRTGKPEPVFASVHDLRRSFGFRWALVVEATVLKELMRHTSVDTTLQYYVGIQAKRMLAHIRDKVNQQVNEPGVERLAKHFTSKKESHR